MSRWNNNSQEMYSSQGDDDSSDYGDYFGPSRAQVNNTFEVQLLTEPFLESLRLGWLGLQYDEKGELVRMSGVSPRMNITGAESLIAFMRTKMHQFNSLSWYDNDQINRLMMDVSMTITFDLVFNHKRYGIRKEDLQILENEIESAIYANYQRAFKGFTSNQINKNISRVERNEDQPKVKRSIF